MGPRRRAREHALKMLYQAELASLDARETASVHWKREDERDPSVRAFAEALVHGVLDDPSSIDALISAVSHRWPIERLGTVERNVLRLAIAEMKLEPETPPAVVIDEAVEIARDFGDAESGSFVNGLLEAARKRLRARPADEAEEGEPR